MPTTRSFRSVPVFFRKPVTHSALLSSIVFICRASMSLCCSSTKRLVAGVSSAASLTALRTGASVTTSCAMSNAGFCFSSSSCARAAAPTASPTTSRSGKKASLFISFFACSTCSFVGTKGFVPFGGNLLLETTCPLSLTSIPGKRSK